MTRTMKSKHNAQSSTHDHVAPPPHLCGDVTTPQARSLLLEWYDENQRQLPWRGIDNPWATWVSEIMLQQTRVSSVLEYFDRFMTRFPNPRALAEAEWDEVASLWAGLGYYRRAKNLWRGAQDVVERHGGIVPSDAESVRELTGVGPYTAGAILSIAFNQPAPLVDGNVARVFARLYRIDQEQQTSAAQKLFWRLAAEWVQGERPGDFNQALMELGATVCRPKSPTCLLCPLRAQCRAAQESDPTRYPVKKSKKKVLPTEDYIALLISRDTQHVINTNQPPQQEYVVIQRAGEGLLGGMWGLPHLRRIKNDPQAPQAEEIAEACLQWINHLSAAHDQVLRRSLVTDSSAVVENELEEKTSHQHMSKLKLIPSSLEPVEVTHRFTHKRWRWWVVSATLTFDAKETSTPKHTQNQPEDSSSADEISALNFADAHLLDQIALGGPSLKGFRAVGVPLKARRGSGR